MEDKRKLEIAEKLREFAEFAQGDYVYMPVNVEDEYYEADLGQFGTQQTTVSIEEDSYQFDADDILDKFPIRSNGFLELAQELEEDKEPEQEEATLDSVLARMEQEGDGPLVQAIRAIVTSFRDVASQLLAKATAIVPLPPMPLPWPGALRSDIDYTAPDFPMRYQPPPGYDWAAADDTGTRVPYTEAQFVDASVARGPGARKIVIDSGGRVTWTRSDRQLDSFESGIRWSVWYLERDGIPAGASFNGGTWPRALNEDGETIEYKEVQDNEPGQLSDDRMWDSAVSAATGRIRAREIRRSFPAEGVVALNNKWGVNYDPLTVSLEITDSYVDTELLRVGDRVSSYGRVARVEGPDEDNDYVITFLGADRSEFTDTRTSFTWLMNKIVGWSDQPTALSLSAGAPALGYDPLTVTVADNNTSIRTEDLRVGDDVTGDSFGRVLTVTEDGADSFVITMNRDGEINTERTYSGMTWDVLPIVGVDRLALPTALSLSQRAPYDPLTVPLKDEKVLVASRDLRLGDDIVGSSFGRVVAIEGDQIVMNRDGAENRTMYKDTFKWEVRMIDVPNRDSLPTVAQAAPEPAF